MNTLRRPRKRPREDSISFRTLWWLLRCEARLAIWCASFSWSWPDSMRRKAVLELHPYKCPECSRRRMDLRPETRYVP